MLFRSQALEQNAGLITQNLLDATLKLFEQSSKVLILGVGGGSTMLGQELQFRLFRLGYACTAYSDPVLMRMAAASVDKADLVICLSQTGAARDIVDAADIAKSYSGNVLAITADASPLAELSDICLPIFCRESDFIFKPTAGRYVMLAAIDLLVTEVAQAQPRKSRDKLRRIKHHLDLYRGGHERQPLGD